MSSAQYFCTASMSPRPKAAKGFPHQLLVRMCHLIPPWIKVIAQIILPPTWVKVQRNRTERAAVHNGAAIS